MRLIALFSALFVAFTSIGQPLALHPANPRYFLWNGKAAVLVGSTEHYGAVLNLDFDYVKYLETIGRDGLNLTRTFSGTYLEIPESFNITDNTLAPKAGRYIGPWAKNEAGKFDLSKFDERYFERLKDFVGQAHKHGVVVEYVIFCTLYNDKLWDVSPMNPKNHVNDVGQPGRTEVFTLKHPKLLAFQEALVRKVVTELNGFDNLYFEICNEPYFEGVADDWQARIAQVIVETEKGLAKKHLIAQNIANDKKKVEKVTPGVSILNFHYATPPETVEMNYHHKLVIGDDETGFKGKADYLYRTEGWDFLIAGGALYNNLDYSFTPGRPDGTLVDYKSPGGGSADLRKSLAAARRFMESFELLKMKPMNGIIKGGKVAVALAGPRSKTDSAREGKMTVRVLGEEGKQYAIYLRGGSGGQIDVELPKGAYKVEWINPRDGSAIKSEELSHDGGVRSLESPVYEQDIAARIVAR